MDIVKNYISNIMRKVRTKEDKYDLLPLHERAVVSLYYSTKDHLERMIQVQNTLRQVDKYDARSMTFWKIIKIKLNNNSL